MSNEHEFKDLSQKGRDFIKAYEQVLKIPREDLNPNEQQIVGLLSTFEPNLKGGVDRVVNWSTFPSESSKRWYAGVAYDKNGQGSNYAILAESYVEAIEKFYEYHDELMNDSGAFVDLYKEAYQTKVQPSDDLSIPIIKINEIDLQNLSWDIRQYFKH